MSKDIITKTIFIPQNDYSVKSCDLPPYSKLLNIHIVGKDEMNLIFESPSMDTNNYGNYGSDKKTFTFEILSGLYQDNNIIDEKFVYHDTIRVQESDFIEYYHIFYDEGKSISEIRDEKLEDIIEK